MNFNLAHVIPNPKLHGLNGYKDVIDTVHWGLQQLGHSVDYRLNEFAHQGTNILFGAQMVPLEIIETLPSSTIVYNFEQVRGIAPEAILPQLKAAARRLQIWDYCEDNLRIWRALGAKNPQYVPVGYAPVLQRMQKPAVQDIDVLIYGMPGQDRLGAFHYLAHAGLTVLFVSGLYGQARDELIARSKLVLNINLYAHSKIFEIVRVSYLLANRKAVVADVAEDTLIDADMRSAVFLSGGAQLVDDCKRLAGDDVARAALEEAGFQAIAQRDIRSILQKALDA